MDQKTKQLWLEKYRPQINPCARCGSLEPELVELPNKEGFELRCKCGFRIPFAGTTLGDSELSFLTTFYNMLSVQDPLCEQTKNILGIKNGSLVVCDIRNYQIIRVFEDKRMLPEAMDFMHRRFNQDLELRTALFQLDKNDILNWVMLSDDLYDTY